MREGKNEKEKAIERNESDYNNDDKDIEAVNGDDKSWLQRRKKKSIIG